MKKMLSVINHQGNANKTTMRYHLTPVRMAIIKKTKDKCGKHVEKREPCLMLEGM
jgi:hypothetical protein